MKKTLFLFAALSSLLFSVDVKFNYKINNDELLYKKRIMEDELLNKDFNHIVALKSYLIYNEFTASNAFINFKLRDPAVPENTWTQQFLLKQNNAGTPTIFEIQPEYHYDLDAFVAGEIGTSLDKKQKYFLPEGYDYTTVDSFLKYAYSHTLKFVLRDRMDVIQRKINTYGFFLTLEGDLTNSLPKISTSNLSNLNMGSHGRTLNTALFSFRNGFDLSKKIPLKNLVQPDETDPAKPYINKDKLSLNKNLDINFSPSFISLIKEEDNFLVDLTQEIFDTTTQQNTTITKTVQIVDFYIIKAEIELVKD